MFNKLPQKVRDWYPKHGAQSDATKNTDGSWTIGSVRDFTYTRDKHADEVWAKGVHVDVTSIVRAWLLLEPFTNSPFVAHPYYIFEYADGSTLCFTIEGKRLNGSGFSGLKGVLNEYELGYIWITEKDCLTMPLTHDAKALYLYPLTLSAERARALCVEFLKDTHTLFETPEFYHTLFNNCTGRFAESLGRVGVRAPRDISWYLPGYIDTYLKRIGLIAANVQLRDPAKDLMNRQDEVWSLLESPGVARIRILG